MCPCPHQLIECLLPLHPHPGRPDYIYEGRNVDPEQDQHAEVRRSPSLTIEDAEQSIPDDVHYRTQSVAILISPSPNPPPMQHSLF